MADSISVCTINVNGLRNNLRRKSVFRSLKQKRYDIICIQESFIQGKDKDIWEKEWGGQLFCSPSSTRSKGQVILVSKRFSYQTHCTYSSDRILTVTCNDDNNQVNIVNVYAPNNSQEKRVFYDTLAKYVESLEGEIIICGDFNCVLDNDLDVVSGQPHIINDVNGFQNMLVNSELNDVWRLHHPDDREYTWSRRSPLIARRLDYIFASDAIFDRTVACNIGSMSQTDHRLVELIYKVTLVQRGPSYWKFNDSLLRDVKYVQSMNSLIEKYIEDNSTLDAQTKWDLCKIKIREFTIAYSTEKKRNHKNIINQLEKDLNDAEKKLSSCPENVQLINQVDTLKRKLEMFALEEARSAQVRSRVKFIEDGEKNTKYFLNLERARANGKIMDRLKTDNGETLTAQNDILTEQVRFYRDVYTKKKEFDAAQANSFMADAHVPTLTDEQRQTLDTDISLTEILSALKTMNNNTSPGPDGLTTSFLKFFWPKLNQMIFESFTASFQAGELSITQRQAVITLIHKGKELPRDEISNWRPISLTNTDYKLLAKCIASRLSTTLSDIIHENQVGFMKGRKVSTMIRLIDDTVETMNLLNKPGILLAVDYRRAFDSISKDFIIWAFKRFGFGEYFVRWVHVLTTGTESCINYLGWLSESFPVDSGIRQGCPFSPLAFIVALEMLAIKIRTDKHIKGLQLPSDPTSVTPFTFLKILLYADDITMFLHDSADLDRVLHLIHIFSMFSNLEINKNKTEAMWLGSQKNNNEKTAGLKWTAKVKIVGIVFSNATPASLIEENWSKRLEKMQHIIASWSKRNLSISGKICIIKTFLLSQFTYVLQSLILPPVVLNKINTILFRFLWKKKYSNTRAFEKVKRVVMCSNTENGGLKMIDINTMQQSCLLTWAINLLQSNGETWSILPKFMFSNLGSNLSCFMSNVSSKLFSGLTHVKSLFWRQVFSVWLDNVSKLNENGLGKMISVNCNNLWNNASIVYRNKALFFKDWVKARICYISDVFKDGSFVSYDLICQKVGNKPTRQFEYNAICTALRARAAEHLLNSNNLIHYNVIDVHQTITLQKVRQRLVAFSEVHPCAKNFWQRKYGIELSKDHWSIAKTSTREERLRLLHWKLLHNIYPTNILLFKMGVKDSIRCSYCADNDYIEHFFWNCAKIKKVWKLCTDYIFKKSNCHVQLVETDVMFGYRPENGNNSFVRFVNHVILIVKMTISKFKYGKGYDIAVLFEKELELREKYLLC